MNDFEKYWEENASKESWANKAVAWNIWKEKQAIIDQLNSVLDERTKEWLQAIELGAYFENVAKPLKEENDRLKAQLNNMETCYIEKKKELDELQKTNISLEAGLRKNSKNKQKLLGKNIELQKRIDGAVAMLTGVCGKVFIGDVVDTLRGANDSLTDMRQKVENQINNGARLTKHQIDL